MNHGVAIALLTALLGTSCASTESTVKAEVTFSGEAGGVTTIEIVAPSRGSTGDVYWLLAQQAAAEQQSVITGYRATLFEDVDNSGSFDEGDLMLNFSYCTTDIPSSHIRISGLKAPCGVKVDNLRVLVELETTLGIKSTAFRP